MNNQIRSVGLATLVVFGIVLANLTWLQVVSAERLVNHERNLRLLLREYSVERGAILSADGQTLAHSQATEHEELKFLRLYPHGRLFAHLTGFYSLVYGREGLERTHNDELSGRGGVLTIQDLQDLFLGRGQKGDTLVLSIDSRVQTAAAEALGNRRGAVVALDPLNGQVLAMTSFPSFDPNPLSGHVPEEIRAAWEAFQADADKPMLNRASAEAYPPGSTFKVVTAAAALEAGRGVETAYPAATQYQPPQTERVIHNFGGSSCGGNMADALRVSCNIYFAQLGAELPQEAFERTAQGFGFGEVPPLDLRAGRSRIPSSDDLRSPAFRAQAAIGQFDVASTPLQMALVAAAIANDGQVPVPKLVREVRDARGVVVGQASAEVWRRAISPQTSQTLTDLMVSVVDSGTGAAARIPGISVAGKTGTAQTGREGEAPHAWFIAFAPARAPRIAVAVVVENGGDLGNEATGGRLAAPIARQVIQAYREVAGW